MLVHAILIKMLYGMCYYYLYRYTDAEISLVICPRKWQSQDLKQVPIPLSNFIPSFLLPPGMFFSFQLLHE